MFIATARALPLEKRDLSAHIAKWLSLSKIFPIPARVPFVDVDTGQCRSTRSEQSLQNSNGFSGLKGLCHVAKIVAIHSRMANIDCGHSSDRSSALSFFF
jgi:hypothetical protein